MSLFKRKIKFFAGIAGGPEGGNSKFSESDQAPETPGIPLAAFSGYQPAQFHVTVPGAVSYQGDPSPVTFARYNMSRGRHDVQLSNGWQRTNYGKRTTYASSGYLASIVPQVPGQSRLIGQGGSTGNFTPKTQSAVTSSGWANIVTNAQAASVNTVSGPGTAGGPVSYMGQSGG